MAEINIETEKKVKIIDCSNLFPPEPMEVILEAVELLKADEAILMLHRKEPLPLYKKLEERHCRFEVKIINQDSVQILIWKIDNEDQ